MIDNILTSPVLFSPWKHCIINNVFLTVTEWDKIVNAATILSTKLRDGDVAIPLEYSTFLGVERSTIEIINNFGESFFNARNKIFDHLNVKFDTSDFSLYIKWGTIKNKCYYRHCDKSSKALTFVVYVFPEHSNGTCLYLADTDEDLVSIVQWTPNTGLIFVPEQNVTWHNYYNYSNTSRITLLFCIYKN